MIGFTPKPHVTLRQGDILLAPAARFYLHHGAPFLAPGPDVVGAEVDGALWGVPLVPGVPFVGAEAGYFLAVILSHDCELEKDFNERVSQLVREDVPLEDAVRSASDDPELDPYAVVAPLLPLASFPKRRHQGILEGQRIGLFPVPDLPLEPDPFAADLFRVATVSTALLRSSPKVASLDETSVFILRYKLSEAYTSRDLATMDELQAAVGARILHVEAKQHGKAGKRTSLVLHLEGKEALHLDVRSLPGSAAPGVTRKPPSGP